MSCYSREQTLCNSEVITNTSKHSLSTLCRETFPLLQTNYAVKWGGTAGTLLKYKGWHCRKDLGL